MSSRDEVMVYGQFLSDLWQLIKRNYPPERDSETYWQQLLHDCSSLGLKYHSAKFVVKMITAAYTELERCAKQEVPDSEMQHC